MLAESSYCERIDQTTYEIQSKTADKHLLALLDQILTDENLNPTEKFEQLKRVNTHNPENNLSQSILSFVSLILLSTCNGSLHPVKMIY